MAEACCSDTQDKGKEKEKEKEKEGKFGDR